MYIVYMRTVMSSKVKKVSSKNQNQLTNSYLISYMVFVKWLKLFTPKRSKGQFMSVMSGFP